MTVRKQADNGPSIVMIVAIIAALIGLTMLFGCVKAEPPVYVTSELPAIPAECLAASPREPQLPDQDISDIVAVRDREAWKKNARIEKQNRTTCAERLKVLLPAT